MVIFKGNKRLLRDRSNFVSNSATGRVGFQLHRVLQAGDLPLAKAEVGLSGCGAAGWQKLAETTGFIKAGMNVVSPPPPLVKVGALKVFLCC